MWVQRELHIAAALNLERADDLECAVAQHVVFLVGERLARSDDNGVAGMHADRVDIFHVADGDRRVIRIAHDLILDFLISFDALFHEHLVHGRELQGVFQDVRRFLVVGGEAAARAAQGERRAQHDRIADLVRSADAFLDGMYGDGGEHRLAQLFAELFEQRAVLGAVDALAARAQKLNLTFAEHAAALQLHREV